MVELRAGFSSGQGVFIYQSLMAFIRTWCINLSVPKGLLHPGRVHSFEVWGTETLLPFACHLHLHRFSPVQCGLPSCLETQM